MKRKFKNLYEAREFRKAVTKFADKLYEQMNNENNSKFIEHISAPLVDVRYLASLLKKELKKHGEWTWKNPKQWKRGETPIVYGIPQGEIRNKFADFANADEPELCIWYSPSNKTWDIGIYDGWDSNSACDIWPEDYCEEIGINDDEMEPEDVVNCIFWTISQYC